MDKDILGEEFKNLNEEQKKVAYNLCDNLLVLSPAGTGKTKTIAARCANIIFSGIEASKIMCLTFTNKACNEMKERIRTSVGTVGDEIYIRTFHSFCFDVIKSEARKNTDISSDFLVFDEEDSREIIKEVNLKSYPSRVLETFIYDIKHFSLSMPKEVREDYKVLVNEYFKVNLETFKEKAIRKNDPIDCLKALVNYGHILLKKYDLILKERHGMDFSDLVVKCYEIFEDDEIAIRWRNKYKFIQVDEIQDTSLLEYSIIEKLAKGNNLSFFGDTNQTIYGWRGSKPFHILESFKKNFLPIKEIHLTTNYRSTDTLLNASCSYLDKVRRVYFGNGIYLDTPISYFNDEGEKIKYKRYRTIEEEGNAICDIIKKDYSDSLNSVAILTRNNELNKVYSSILEKRGIPAFLVDEYKFFRRKEIKDMLAFLKLALNKYDVNSMKRISFEFVAGVGDKTIEYIEKSENKAIGIRLTDFIEKATIEYGDPYYDLTEDIDIGNVVVFDVESTGVDVNKDEIVQIAAVKLCSDGSYTVFEEFLKPSKSVGDSERVHGFSDEFLKENGCKPQEGLRKFLEFIDGTVIVGHNVQYDLSILKSQLYRLGMSDYRIKDFYDTLDMSRKLFPELPNHKLSTLSDYIGVSQLPDHNAMNDILATKDVLLHMVKRLRSTYLDRMRVMSSYRKRFLPLYEIIVKLKKDIDIKRPHEVLNDIYIQCGVDKKYKNDPKRIENLEELYLFFKKNDNININPRDSLRNLLTITSLSNSEIDRASGGENKVPIITVHQGKGLEFQCVFIPALNEGDFPSYFSKTKEEMVEECRLFYVAMTRAKSKLYLSSHEFNGKRNKKESRFLYYIDDKHMNKN
ncbi:3'-5' exonuclease [Clostridium cadaveris]|uniref:3'-5' exonuclease n=1 Tax=Clostridium cadaveris TaxID=1529 RepID=UPI0015B3DBD3|nr:3'-5' exonuclease [Clostridium cadaveris]NWK12755.1 UvrD-helicase domain-containing protein [Clostridium cadaveris]